MLIYSLIQIQCKSYIPQIHRQLANHTTLKKKKKNTCKPHCQITGKQSMCDHGFLTCIWTIGCDMEDLK
jgi:hypothetical protein